VLRKLNGHRGVQKNFTTYSLYELKSKAVLSKSGLLATFCESFHETDLKLWCAETDKDIFVLNSYWLFSTKLCFKPSAAINANLF